MMPDPSINLNSKEIILTVSYVQRQATWDSKENFWNRLQSGKMLDTVIDGSGTLGTEE